MKNMSWELQELTKKLFNIAIRMKFEMLRVDNYYNIFKDKGAGSLGVHIDSFGKLIIPHLSILHTEDSKSVKFIMKAE